MPPKPRGPPKQRPEVDETPEIEPREQAEWIKTVELEMKKKLVGGFKVTRKDVTTIWEGKVQNRAPNFAAVDKLHKSMLIIGVRRLQSEHHMVGTSCADDISGMLHALNQTRKSVTGLNAKLEFPIGRHYCGDLSVRGFLVLFWL